MKKIILSFLILQGVLMSQSVEYIKIKEVNVPIIFEEQTTLPIVSVQLVFIGGGSIRDGEIEGLSRFTSKVLSEGTKELGSLAFAQALERRAINFSVNSGSETLVFELSSLKEEFDFGLNMLKNLFVDPNLSDEVFLKVKTQTFGLILNKESDFDYIASTRLRTLMFENTPIGNIPLGTNESIEKISKNDVKNFIDSVINLNNLIIVIGGDIDKSKAIDKLKNLISELKIGSRNELGYFEVSKSKKSITQTKDTEQAYIYFGSPLHVRYDDKNIHKAKVASFILGEGGFGSRLMEEIRVKRGLAYSAYARFNIDKTSSSMVGYLQTKISNKEEAIKIVKEVLKEFSNQGVTNEEFEQAKRFLLGSEPLRVETLSQRLSRSFSEYYRGFELGHSKKELKKIENLTLKELNDFIKSHVEINNLIFSIVTNDDNKSER